MRRILTIVCALTVLLASTHSNAEEKMLTSSEVENIVSETCVDNNIEFSYVHVEEGRQFTQKEVDDMVAELLEMVSSNDVTPIVILDTNKLGRDELRGNAYNPNYMESHFHFADEKYIANDWGSGATIGIEMDATVNLGANTFVSVESLSSRQYGLSLNFKSWTQRSAVYSISSDYRTVYITIKGTMETAVAVAGAVVVGVTKDHTITTSASLN